jgi:transposase
MRIIGLDIHRAFAEAVAWDDEKLKRLGRVDMRRALLTAFAQKLSEDDTVLSRRRAMQRLSQRLSLRMSRRS